MPPAARLAAQESRRMWTGFKEMVSGRCSEGDDYA
jgi:hypothetical protein